MFKYAVNKPASRNVHQAQILVALKKVWEPLIQSKHNQSGHHQRVVMTGDVGVAFASCYSFSPQPKQAKLRQFLSWEVTRRKLGANQCNDKLADFKQISTNQKTFTALLKDT